MTGISFYCFLWRLISVRRVRASNGRQNRFFYRSHRNGQSRKNIVFMRLCGVSGIHFLRHGEQIILLFFIAYCCSYILSFRVPISNISHQDPENDFHFDAVLLLIPLWFTDSHPTSYLSLAGFEVCFSISHVSPGRSAV